MTSDEHTARRSSRCWRVVRAHQRPGRARGGRHASTAAIIAEPFTAKAASGRSRRAFAAAINEACAKTGALLIDDEIQSGLGRTGHPFYFPALGLKPDLVAVGKALGGGVPIGSAFSASEVA